jgi:hypothetical protein
MYELHKLLVGYGENPHFETVYPHAVNRSLVFPPLLAAHQKLALWNFRAFREA